MAEVTSNSSVIIKEGTTGRPYIETLNKLKSGYTPAENDLLMEKDVVDITTQAVVGLSSPALVGMSDANTTNGLLYGKIINGTGGAGDAFVVLYSDSARSAEVAKSDNLTRATMTIATMSASNASGLSGTIAIAANTANSADQVLTTRKELSRYDRDDLTNRSIKGVISYYDSASNHAECFSAPLVAKLDGIGCNNVDGMFERDAMAKAALLKNITLV